MIRWQHICYHRIYILLLVQVPHPYIALPYTRILIGTKILLQNSDCNIILYEVFISVAVPDPSDPYVFGPPRSGSVSQRYGSGSRSFYQAKIVSKTLIPTVL
jgi:hypothetical protein